MDYGTMLLFGSCPTIRRNKSAGKRSNRSHARRSVRHEKSKMRSQRSKTHAVRMMNAARQAYRLDRGPGAA